MLDELFQDFRISVRGLLRTPLRPWGWRFKAEPNLVWSRISEYVENVWLPI